jgi:hypothetical protein
VYQPSNRTIQQSKAEQSKERHPNSLKDQEIAHSSTPRPLE